MHIYIDPGHGGSDPGAIGPTGLYEKDCTLQIANLVGTILAGAGVRVNYTRDRDIYLNLDARAALANKAGADYFLSIHINSATNAAATGTETYALSAGGNGEQLAKAVQTALVRGIRLADRGVKFANFAVLRKTKMPAALVEVCFINNPAEEALLRTTVFRESAARGIAQGMFDFLGIAAPVPPSANGTSILSAPRATMAQAQAWARGKGATDTFVTNAALYWEIAAGVGVDPAVAYVQYAKETGYGHFGGVLDATYNNPCGLKTSQGGSDTDPAAHTRFASWAQGIMAHIDHLALYAGAQGYPALITTDPRHFAHLLGTCKTVEALGGKWAPGVDYGTSLVRMLGELVATVAPDAPASEDKPSAWAAEAWRRAFALGVMDGTNPQGPVTREQLAAVLDRLGILEEEKAK